MSPIHEALLDLVLDIDMQNDGRSLREALIAQRIREIIIADLKVPQ